jgi:hypothetical protein
MLVRGVCGLHALLMMQMEEADMVVDDASWRKSKLSVWVVMM